MLPLTAHTLIALGLLWSQPTNQPISFTDRTEFWQLAVAAVSVVAVIVGALAYRIKRDSDTKLERVRGEVADNRAQSESNGSIIKAWSEESKRSADERVRSNEMLSQQTAALTILAKGIGDVASGITDTRTDMKNLPEVFAEVATKAVGKVINNVAENIDDRFKKLEVDMKSALALLESIDNRLQKSDTGSLEGKVASGSDDKSPTLKIDATVHVEPPAPTVPPATKET